MLALTATMRYPQRRTPLPSGSRVFDDNVPRFAAEGRFGAARKANLPNGLVTALLAKPLALLAGTAALEFISAVRSARLLELQAG
jgi:hypothetical protein